MREIVSKVEVLFPPNEREALTITKAQTVEEAAEILHDWGAKLIVVTRGERGGVLVYDGTSREFPALPISPKEIVDPTGAGMPSRAVFSDVLEGKEHRGVR